MKLIPSKKEQLVNPETGEVVDTIAIIPEVRDKDFVKVFKLMTTKVIRDLKAGIDGAVYTLLWFIDRIQEMKPNQEPVIVVDPEIIAEDIGVNKRTIDRHLKTLKKYGYIEQIKKRHHIYRVNPMMIYKGTLTKYFENKHRKKAEKNSIENSEEAVKTKTKTSEFTVDAIIVKEQGDSDEK